MMTELLEFKSETVFPLPKVTSYHQIGNRHLFIATSVPTWIVVDGKEAEVIKRIQSGATIGECVTVLRSHGLNLDVAKSTIKALLRTLVGFFFYRAAEPDDSADKYRRLQIHVTNACNLRCTHCYVSSGLPFKNEMTLNNWKSVIDYMRIRYEKVHVSVSGGEPLMVRWLPELLEYAKIKNGCDTALLTNGMLWTEQKTIELAPLVDRVAVSLDGATPATHDAIRGDGAFEKALQGIAEISKKKIKLGLNLTLMQQNKDDLLLNLYPLITRIGADADIDIANYVAEGRGSSKAEQALSPSDFRDTLARLVAPFLSDTWKPLTMAKRTNCGYGKSFAVYANGDVSPCLSPRFLRGNIIIDGVETLFDSIKQEEAASDVDQLPICKSCDLRYLCGGKCHLNHFPTTRNMRQNECMVDYRKDFYSNLISRFDAMRTTYLV